MKAIAPGKIILSGEHAVVYGAPAIALAVRPYATVTTRPCDGALLNVQTPFGDDSIASAAEADAREDAVQARYRAFLEGNLPIAEVLPDKRQFVALGWMLFRKHVADRGDAGASITATSDLPLGAGMGSSAAIAAALFTSLAAHYHKELSTEECFNLSLELESFQHGHPSGVDPFLVTHGGAVRYRVGSKPEPIMLPARDLCVIHTGPPSSTTGECVAFVRDANHDPALWTEFATVCDDVLNALTEHDESALIAAIRTNHQLLVRIGVVPGKIQQLVSRIEELGGAAKICGAGSIRGKAAGILWVVGEQAQSALPELGYPRMDVEGDPHGARIAG